MHELQNAIGSIEIAQIIKRRIITVHRLEVFEALQGLGYTVPDATLEKGVL